MARNSTRLGRIARLTSLTGKLSTSYLAERAKGVFRSAEAQQAALDQLQLESAEQVVHVLGRLKGAAMKVGQQIAMAANSLDLPEDVSRVLSKLNNAAEPVAFDEIKAAIEVELGAPLTTLFARFDAEPIGTASLGQAHSAALPDGREVVVKVLHEGVRESVATDLAALKAMLVSSRLLRRDKAEVDAGFEEVRERLEEELDYLQEAANIADFHRVYKDDPRVVVPQVHSKWSTERILTMDRVPGVHVDEFVQSATPEARDRAGQTLAQLYYEMAFKHRMLHADPHPGNYLFSPDGTVGLLDFGCVKRFDEFWIANYARTALAAINNDRQAFLDGMRRIDAWHGNNPQAADAMWAFGDTLAGPYRVGPYVIGGAHDSTLDRLRPVGLRLIRHREVQMPRDVIFLHRTLGGLYTIIRQLVATVDLGTIARKELNYAIDYAEGALPSS